ncbi:MAG: DUF1679 domain-containing protein [Paucibacter sp.]|nr:DUF1679 domain-containing protein [Roseateles sp.]
MNKPCVISHPDQVTAVWLGETLHRAGLLSGPQDVAAVEKLPAGDRAWSRITHLRVDYRVPTGLPCRLLLKICAHEAGTFGRSEVDYYLRDYDGVTDAPLPRCFDAAYADEPRRYHLLLEDLSDSHVSGDEALPPDLGLALALGESLASLHAPHWGRVAPPERAEIERYVGHVRPGMEPLLTLAGLDAPWPGWLRGLMVSLADRLLERARDPRGLTLVHGDLNPGNLLIPRSRRGPVLLLDRQPFDWSLTRWLGAGDLVNAVVCWWDEPVRRALGEPLLRRYHAALCERGIEGYTLAQLRKDYELCLAMAVAIPVEWCVRESDRERMRPLWAQQLRRALAACADHGAFVPA